MILKKRIRDGIILAGVFIMAVLVFSYLTNKGDDSMTADLGSATFPQISFDCDGFGVNAVPGYAKQMNITEVRDTITPVLKNKLDMELIPYDNKISSLEYKIYTLDGTECLHEDTVKNPGTDVSLPLGSVSVLGEERVMEVILHLETGKDVYFYTRVAQTNETNMSACMDYIKAFHEATVDKNTDTDISTALEADEESSNTSYGHVTIHSNYSQVTWGDLKPEIEGGERWSVKETTSTGTSVQLEYRVKCKGEKNKQDTYNVKEFFRVRYDKTARRVYLLDYDRTAEQVFDPSSKVLSAKGILLGITDADVPYLINKKGTIVSFVQADELWNYNKDRDELSLVFSFASTENNDARNLTSEHEIRLLTADKAGNITFAVCGYMNRGEHEGEVGIAIYYYDIEKNSVEEKVFVQTDQSYGITSQKLGKLIYYSEDNGELYLLNDGVLRKTDVNKNRSEELQTGLTEGKYVISGDSHLLAYCADEDFSRITILNLQNGKERTISAKNKEGVRPLGFIGGDFVYGRFHLSDVGKTAAGESTDPMYQVEIRSSKGEVVKKYSQKKIYVLDAKVEDNRIILEQAKKKNGTYIKTTEEYITNNEEKDESNIMLETYKTDLKGAQMRLTYADGISDKEPKLLRPKQVLFEKPKVVNVQKAESKEEYYVFGYGKLQEIYKQAGDAIQSADNYGGVVVDQNQEYIWQRGNRDLQYKISATSKPVEGLRSELNGGATPMEAISKIFGEDALDLSGCKAEQIAYVMNQGKPVIAVTENKKYVILIGYTETDVTYVEAKNGKSHTVSLEKMDKKANGNYIGS
ncbi:hypothetical protein DWY31_10495 [Dorea sp. AF24-7LB]|uniref:hypothetical protein n=1 Tax=Dorea sp. AF24-7LB TaxID=2293097 RepID=UPI000E4829A0|nr:hypothetical protein DWY31_10495 [Dorea sp. AF24-7LB]